MIYEEFGTDGDDKLRGHKGVDNYLYGGAGDDRIHGGDRFNYLFGGPGDDVIHAMQGDSLIDTGTGNDIVRAGKGDQLIVTWAGVKYLDGGRGDDIYLARDWDPASGDVIKERPNGGYDKFHSYYNQHSVIPENVEEGVIVSNGLVTVDYETSSMTGNDLGNIMIGSYYTRDTLKGMGGDDRILASDNDIMSGGSGADWFFRGGRNVTVR